MPFILFALIAAATVFVSAQRRPNDIPGIPNNLPRYNPATRPTPPDGTNSKPVKVTAPNKNKVKPKRPILNEADTPAEKSLAVNPNAVVSLCVSEGKVRINGWDRSEIRAYVGGGSQVGFQIQQKDKTTGNPVLLKILGFDPSINKEADADECLSGEEIEIDLPRGASVSIKGAESETTIESIKKVSVDNIGGDIYLNDIKYGIYAKTYRGGITVGNSSGAVNLESANGNIVAYEIGPSEVGDAFKAKTINGMITVQQIGHMQSEITSTSGSIRFNSELLGGGQYNFSTLNGSILLTMPEKSSCKIMASYGGLFTSDMPLKNQKLSASGGIKNLTGQLGDGEAILSLTTYNGKINIKKQ